MARPLGELKVALIPGPSLNFKLLPPANVLTVPSGSTRLIIEDPTSLTYMVPSESTASPNT